MVLITFRNGYRTKYGEHLALIMSNEEKDTPDTWNPRKNSIPLVWDTAAEVWSVTISCDVDAPKFEYKYLMHSGGNNTWEYGPNRALDVKEFKNLKAVVIYDEWRSYSNIGDIEESKVLKDVIYQRDLRSRESTPIAPPKSEELVIAKFSVKCIPIPEDFTLGVTGRSKSLGRWKHPLKMEPRALVGDSSGRFVWTCEASIPREDMPVEYKYVIIGRKSGLTWEGRANRRLSLPSGLDTPDLVVVADNAFEHKKNFRGSGVSVPVFSLRTANSLGIGEYLDLIPFADFVEKSGFSLIQLLPINDTASRLTWLDSYPYGTLSVFALHPIYVNIEALGEINEGIKSKMDEYRQDLEDRGVVDLEYERTYNLKMELLRQMYELYGEEDLKSEEFGEYFKVQDSWLKAYALFSAVRDAHKDLKKPANFTLWREFRTIDDETLQKVAGDPKHKYADAMRFYYYVQFHCHQQMMKAVKYIHSKRIALKGDLPIGVQPHSVDTWQNPRLFKMEMSTGAPPDNFSVIGQNWGFPTYNWEEMAKDDFDWWKRRLSSLAQYFDTYRIDHILGFFRIWEIDRDKKISLLGHFYPSRPFHANELRAAGIWDIKRLTMPYIRHHHLEYTWPDQRARDHVVSKYFNSMGNFYYEFKEEYNTRGKVKDALVKEFGRHFYPKELLRRLGSLMWNVVFNEDSKMPDFYHPRFGCYKSESFANLSNEVRHIVEKFHSDYYGSRNESMFYSTAMQRLPSLKRATNMMVCGEDLGTIPKSVPAVFDQLAILSLRVQRTPRKDDKFAEVVADYPYMSVCTTSTHDFSPLRYWWEHLSPDERNKMWFDYLNQWGSPPARCTTEVPKLILHQHLASPSMWAIFPLQDIMAVCSNLKARESRDEWINDPSNPKNYWKYRCQFTCDELLKSTLPSIMSDMVFAHNRNPLL